MENSTHLTADASSDATVCRAQHYIPVRKVDLNQWLLEEFPASDQSQFTSFCELLDATLHFESHRHLTSLKAAYHPLNPDALLLGSDQSNPEAETEENSEQLIKESIQASSDSLFQQFDDLLTRCNYIRLDREEIEKAIGASSQWGVNLKVDFSTFEKLEVYIRGEKQDVKTRKHWTNLYREEIISTPIYKRLALIFQLHEDSDLPNHAGPDNVYMKLFKNIPKQDVDMLLPGASVCMTLLDQGKIFLPTVTGLVIAIFKIIKGAVIIFTFAGVYGVLMLVGGTIGYGVKSFFGYQRTKEKYHLHLTRNLYYQNLANGDSVLFHLLDEAQSQEYREALLAYSLMIQQPEETRSIEQIDALAELFLKQKAGLDVDFEVDDALHKLERLGLAQQTGGVWKAVPLTQALHRLDQSWDTIFQHHKDDQASDSTRQTHLA
ncbi:MAG: hypothetical protein COA78_28995 [Blastopirellula sp.]|nr:MAG: hypothetical protein COA78_28995 [Blastopirellula sp.]